MVIHDIQYITASVLKLITEAFNVANVPSGNAKLAEPPSRVSKDGIGFFIYHVQENSHYKNMSPLRHDNQRHHYYGWHLIDSIN